MCRNTNPLQQTTSISSSSGSILKMPKMTKIMVPIQAFWLCIFTCILLVGWYHSRLIERHFGPSLSNPGGDMRSLTSMMKTNRHRKFFPVPKESRKLFWIRKSIHHKLYEPVIRAFHSRGYSLTEDKRRAHFLWADHPYPALYKSMQLWQRFSWIPNIELWDDKDSMAYNINEYYARKGQTPLHSFPESYVLHMEEDLRRFQRRLQDGGIKDPWVLKEPTVNQGKGVEIVGPHSKRLLGIMKRKRVIKHTRQVVQKYICNEMTYFGRKFDFRIFWMVASVDPLVVLYQTKHNYVRIGAAAYDETDFSNTRSHLTTHTFGSNEGKATWDEFKVYIQKFHEMQGNRLSYIADPFQHVENQVKTVLAHLADAFKHTTYNTQGITAENAYTWHAADMIIDNDLDVYIIEGTDGPGKDEDYDFRIEMHNVIFGDMIDIVEHIVRRQEKGQPIDVREMERDGVLRSYEVVYNDGWMFDYAFDRLAKSGCSVSETESESTNKVDLPLEVVEVIRAEASLTALPKMQGDAPVKTFYMEEKTRQDGEPIARSLRSKGWVPVDDVGSAQLVFDQMIPNKFPTYLQSWQMYNHVPQEQSIFRMLQASESETKACKPLLYNGRAFSVQVFWLVLSVDPLLVFYHDGFLDIPYDPNDENEFVYPIEGHLRKEQGRNPVWRGSWIGFKSILSNTTIDAGMLHVKGQMKRYLVKAAKTLKKHIQSQPSASQFFGIYIAEFEVDHRLHVMEPWFSEHYIYSEGYQEMVDLHDDVFGSAFDLLEKCNSTNSTFIAALDAERSGYELILDGESKMEFHFSYDGQPERC